MRLLPTFAATVALVLVHAGAHAGGDIAAGKEKSAQCAQCHGADGNSPVPAFPTIAGQYADYIVRALKDYKSGARNNPIMAGFAANLSEQDQEDLAAYYAGQESKLYTPQYAEK